MPSPSADCFDFDGFTLDLRGRLLSHLGQTIELRPKSFDVLAYLVRNSGAVVAKDEIIAAVWPQVFASDESLSRCISDVRAALGDAERRVIRTIPGRGYQFSAQVKEIAAPPAPALHSTAQRRLPSKQLLAGLAVLVIVLASIGLWLAALPDSEQAPVNRATIAVLPFENLSGDPGQDYFADGMAEDLIVSLSKLSALHVIERNASFQYRQLQPTAKRIGRELGSRYLLRGSVRRAGERLRITVQLVDSATSENLWADSYDGAVNDVFALQDQVTGRIVEALSLNLATSETALLVDHGTSSFAAHDEFLKGQSHAARYTAEGANRAVYHYERALSLDPGYLRAAIALENVRFIQKHSGLK